MINAEQLKELEIGLDVLGVRNRLSELEGRTNRQIWTPHGVRTINGIAPNDQGDITIASGGVTSASGTTDRITVSPTTGDVVVDIAATYVGQTSITTLGTIATGVWHGTKIDVPYGGTNLSTIAAGSILAANTLDTLTAITSTSGSKVLTNVAGTTSWSTGPSLTSLTLTGLTASQPVVTNSSKLLVSISYTSFGNNLTHADLGGLSTDDHPQYLLAAGTRALTGNWDAGSFEVRAQTLQSDVATGTAPLIVASTTKVTNLNADLLDDQTGSYYLDSANFTGTNWTDLTDGGATTLHKHDHGGLDGLADDDHTQYALLAGRSGGQTLIGGTAASNNLTLQSTSHATKGYIIASDQIQAPAGTATAPGVVMTGALTSGLYAPTTNAVGLAANGTAILTATGQEAIAWNGATVDAGAVITGNQTTTSAAKGTFMKVTYTFNPTFPSASFVSALDFIIVCNKTTAINAIRSTPTVAANNTTNQNIAFLGIASINASATITSSSRDFIDFKATFGTGTAANYTGGTLNFIAFDAPVAPSSYTGSGLTQAYWALRAAGGLVSTAGTTGNTFKWDASTTAPGTNAGTPTTRYGGDTNYLGDPTIWVIVNIAGTDYKMPAY